MASMGGGYLDLNPDPIIRLVKNVGMVNKILQQILTAEGLKTTGVKAELQERIIQQLRNHAARRDAVRFERLKTMIERPDSIHLHGASGPAVNGFGISTSPATASPRVQNQYPGTYNNNIGGAFRLQGHHNFWFKPSPFYHTVQQLGDTKRCETMQQHRHTVTMPLKVQDHPILARVQNDPLLRVMVFCSTEGHGLQDITFPHQSEIKVNGGEVKANLRGLKNKPGSTRPVDITKELRLNLPHYGNSVEMTYALTSKKFYLVLYVVQAVPVADLVRKLEVGKRISKEKIVNDMISKARDADIVATSTVLSLKCPLSTLRIDLPCRSISCRHNQCFDATSYLQLQEQGPTWLCPICNNSAPYETLAVDEYVKEILKSTPKSADQVIIEPNGAWKLHNKPEPSSKFNGASFGSDDDDDIIEITKLGQITGTPLAYKTPMSATSGPSREQSASSAAQRPSLSGKRPISAVIDLTSSGDEDDEPLVRQPKRQFNGYGTPSNVPAYRPGQSSGYTSHP